MPLLAAARLNARLSSYFYSYGRLCASRTWPFLTLALSLVFLFSFPVVARFFESLPLTAIPPVPLDQLDAQVWLLSPYIRLDNISATDTPHSFVMAQQIRVAVPEKVITKDLLVLTHRLENALRSTSVQVHGKPQSLANVCIMRQRQCVIQSPAMYWKHLDDLKQDKDWIATVNGHRDVASATGLSMHPVSVFGNVTLNAHGYFVNADSVVLTVLLKQQPSTMDDSQRVWSALWREVSQSLQMTQLDTVPFQENHFSLPSGTSPIAYHKQTSETPQTIRFKPTPWPMFIPGHIYLSIAAYAAVFCLVSAAFHKANLVKSNYTFGLAAVFISLACFTTTCGILDQIGIELHTVPRYLLPVISGVAAIENVFLLTNAVISAGCDMQVREKVARGLESIGVPMTATLIVEISILAIGAKMDILFVKEFCVFAQTTLMVEYFLQLTFYLAVLSIDVHRVELADLDDRQMSKRLREISNCDLDADQNPDYCPIQEDADEGEAKTCAECKEFKTHRAVNALLLCLILLSSFLFRSRIETHYMIKSHPENESQQALASVSSLFWKTTRSVQDVQWLQVNPPRIVIYSDDLQRSRIPMQDFIDYYATKTPFTSDLDPTQLAQGEVQAHRPSLFRNFLYALGKRVFGFVCRVNVPALLLSVVLVGIIMWLTPRWRKQWLIPFVKWNFVVIALRLMAFASSVVASWKFGLFSRQGSEYDVDGVHIGAISAQQQFNKQQRKSGIKKVRIKTLSGKHISDIRRLDVNAKHNTLVSCGEDGRVILWDAEKAQWMARLDRWHSSNMGGGALEGDLHPEYYQNGAFKYMARRSPRDSRLPPATARCVKIDAGNRWIASGFDNGMVRVWDARRGFLVRELNVSTEIPLVVEQDGLVRRRHRNTDSAPKPPPSASERYRSTAERVVALQFVGAVAEYCHPLVAEVAARLRTANSGHHASPDLEPSQNHLVSLHKRGILREWDIISGECIQTISLGHNKDVTLLQAVECRPPHRKLGVTWVFTASKDGVIKCWERRLNKTTLGEETVKATTWTCAYTLVAHPGNAIMTLATEFPVGGMGILVTGSSDGAVKVWNFESGEHVCTLSNGGIRQRNSPIQLGGPLLPFSKFTAEPQAWGEAPSVRSGLEHHGAISQIAVTRYCEVKTGPGMCRGCDTCFGNGFFVAWSSADDLVHVWRLERSDGGHDGSCSLCSKDYHRKQYRRPRTSMTNETPPPTTLPRVIRRPRPPRSTLSSQPSPATQPSSSEWTDDLMDIEQLAGDNSAITLAPTFLGKIDQLAGRGLVFCNNMILAGVRQKPSEDPFNAWETWFASLQYYDPSETADASSRIPVETFSLDTAEKEDDDDDDTTPTSSQSNPTREPHTSSPQRILQSAWSTLFGQNKKIHGRQPHHVSLDGTDSDEGEMTDDDDELGEANENLPFSAVRHVVGLEGSGLACEYGNFIKLVYLDDERRLAKTDPHTTSLTKTKTITSLAPDAFTCGSDKDVCCSSPIKKKPLPEVVRPATTATCTVRNLAECSSRTNCPRASDCNVSSHAGGRRSSTTPYNWR